jgi:hypothetical protein
MTSSIGKPPTTNNTHCHTSTAGTEAALSDGVFNHSADYRQHVIEVLRLYKQTTTATCSTWLRTNHSTMLWAST